MSEHTSEQGDQNFNGALNNNDMSIGISSVHSNYQSEGDNSSMKSFGS